MRPMRILAAIHSPEDIRKILECLGLPSRPPPISSAVSDHKVDEQAFFRARNPASRTGQPKCARVANFSAGPCGVLAVRSLDQGGEVNTNAATQKLTNCPRPGSISKRPFYLSYRLAVSRHEQHLPQVDIKPPYRILYSSKQ